MAGTWVRQQLFDVAAIAASLACLVHCLALPMLLIAAPTLAAFFALPESLHMWTLAFAVPKSVLALRLGWLRHRRMRPARLALPGLALMAVALMFAPGEQAETVITVAGTLMLAIGHALNWRALRHRPPRA